MNIYTFLNSKDEAKYLRSINYDFRPLEAAFVVYISKKATYRQKINAWQEILHMPNCEMPPRRNYWHENNLHDFLLSTISEWKRNEDEFWKTADCVFCYKYRDVDYNWQYPSLELLLNDMEKQTDCDDLKFGYTVRKQRFTEPFAAWEAYFDKRHRLLNIIRFDKNRNLNDLSNGPHELGFEGLWFDIPTPFKKGDILVEKSRFDDNNEPFVLVDLPNWSEDDLKSQGIFNPEELAHKKRLYELHDRQGDYTDMCAYALYADKNSGEIFHEHPMTYIDFEYYRGKLQDGYATLKTIADYLQNNRGLEFLLRNYTHNLDKCRADIGYFDD